MSKLNNTPDIFGNAISDFFHTREPATIVVLSDDFDEDEIPVEYLFRTYQEMPALEKMALNHCRGKTLDVGCGAGSHSLYLQENKKLDVTAIDISKKAAETGKLRGLKKVRSEDFFQLNDEKFDTILLLMNGIGLVGKLVNLERFFQQLKTLLAPKGQVILDSSDISYLFEETEDGGVWVDASKGYYGELEYQTAYKNEVSNPFAWLFIDFQTLQFASETNGFKCEMLQKGKHYDYLAKLTLL